ncbi:unnamed protein product, partial [Didymodactylos carnosus]
MVDAIIHVVGALCQCGLLVAEVIDVSKRNSTTDSTISSTRYHRATLTTTSDQIFGKEVERLVNIAFSTGQTFPTMMKTYLEVVSYIKKELAQHYSNEQFIVVIGRNSFDFQIDYAQY